MVGGTKLFSLRARLRHKTLSTCPSSILPYPFIHSRGHSVDEIPFLSILRNLQPYSQT